MSNAEFLVFGVAAFSLMAAGLGMTIMEFRNLDVRSNRQIISAKEPGILFDRGGQDQSPGLREVAKIEG